MKKCKKLQAVILNIKGKYYELDKKYIVKRKIQVVLILILDLVLILNG